MIAKYNERKLQVLEFVRDYQPITSDLLADGLGIEVHNARMLLLKYFRQSLLKRRSERGLYKKYWISEKGLSRIEWLKDESKKTE